MDEAETAGRAMGSKTALVQTLVTLCEYHGLTRVREALDIIAMLKPSGAELMKNPHIYVLTTKEEGKFSIGVGQSEDFDGPEVDIVDLGPVGREPRLWNFNLTNRFIWSSSQNPKPQKR